MEIKMSSKVIQVQSKRIRCNWTVDMAKDISLSLGMGVNMEKFILTSIRKTKIEKILKKFN